LLRYLMVARARQTPTSASQADQPLGLPRLCLRGTFIDLQENVELSPRAHSEPRSRVQESEFDADAEQSYIQRLASREFLYTQHHSGEQIAAQHHSGEQIAAAKCQEGRVDSQHQLQRSSGSAHADGQGPGVLRAAAWRQKSGQSPRVEEQEDNGGNEIDDTRSTCTVHADADSCRSDLDDLDMDESVDESTTFSVGHQLQEVLPRQKNKADDVEQIPEAHKKAKFCEAPRWRAAQQGEDSHTIASSDTFRGNGQAMGKDGRNNEERKDFFLGRPGPRSEPGLHTAVLLGNESKSQKKRGQLPRRIETVPTSLDLLNSCGTLKVSENQSAGAANAPLDHDSGCAERLCGVWRGSLGIWTIEEDGRALFNGGHIGDDYDIDVHKDGEETIIQRGDGWKVNHQLSSLDTLVWTTMTPGEEMTWKRVSKTQAAYPTETQSREQLRSKMAASAQQFSDAWSSERRRSTALAAIEEIPIRIGDDMQKVTSQVVDDVQFEVNAMRKHIRKENAAFFSGGTDTSSAAMEAAEEKFDEATAKVVKHLEAIPTMILNLLEARVGKAKQTVRHRVQGMMQNLSSIQEESWEGNGDALASQMKRVSEEVELIAGEAVEAAALECRAHAARQLDFALTTLRGQKDNAGMDMQMQGEASLDGEKSKPADWGNWGAWGADKAPTELWPEKPSTSVGMDGEQARQSTGSWWKSTVAEAVAVVQSKDYVPQSIANQFVADELLRAKTRNGSVPSGQSRSAVSQLYEWDVPTIGGMQDELANATGLETIVENIGSIGHPDLCQRPCVYYSAGNCVAAQDCTFCHLPHPKRPVRLDKRHRETLKSMGFPDLLKFVVPVLRQKLSEMGRTEEVDSLVSRLQEYADAKGATSSSKPSPAKEAQQRWEAASAASSSMHPQGRKGSAAASDIQSEVGSNGSNKRRDNFAGALQVMSLRSLLTIVSRLAPDGEEEVQNMLQQVLSLSYEAQLQASITISEACFSEVSREQSTLRSIASLPMKPSMSVQPLREQQSRGTGRRRKP